MAHNVLLYLHDFCGFCILVICLILTQQIIKRKKPINLTFLKNEDDLLLSSLWNNFQTWFSYC